MLPIRPRSIFRNRWIALLWAGGIVWSAVQFVGAQKEAADANGNLSAADRAALDTALDTLSH